MHPDTDQHRTEPPLLPLALTMLMEGSLDRLARLVARHFAAPIALAGLVDESGRWHWRGLAGDLPSRDDLAFVVHTVQRGRPLLVPDAAVDPRFRTERPVQEAPHVRAYAGAPIVTPSGPVVGVVCVLDHAPRVFGPEDAVFLDDLAALASSELRVTLTALGATETLRAFEHNGHALVAFDNDVRLTFVNSAARDLYRVDEHVLGAPLDALFTGRWRSADDEAACRAAMRQGQPWSGEVTHHLPDGRELQVEAHLSPTFDTLGQRTGYLLLVRDVTGWREEERLMRLLLDNAQDTLVLHDPTGRILYANRTAERHLRAAELEGRDGYDLMHPDDRARVRRESHDIALTGRVTDIEWRRLYADGRVTWMETRTTPILDAEGRVQYLIAVNRDITARREAQAYTELLESVAVHANDAVVITTALPLDEPYGPRIVYVNDAFCRMTGYAREEIVGRTPRVLQGPRTDRAQLDRVRAALETWQSITLELVNYRKDGSEFAIELSLVPAGSGETGPTHWICIQRDVTERRANDERLRLLESAVVNAADAIVIVRREGDDPAPRVWYVNEAFTRMMGVAPDALVGQPLSFGTLDPDGHETVERLLAAPVEGRTAPETLALRGPDGRTLWASLAVTPVAGRDDRVSHWICVLHDVTRQKRQLDLEHDRRQVLEMVTSGRALPEVLAALQALLERQLDGMTVAVHLLQHDRLHEAVASPLPPEFREVLGGTRVAPTGTSGAAAAYGKTTVISEDIRADARWTGPTRTAALSSGLLACWSAPVFSRNRTVLGTLDAYGGAPASATPEQLEMLEDAARLAAVVLERYRTLDEMQRLALYDTLTGLPNRTWFAEHLRDAMAGCAEGEVVAVGLVDVDRFKTINDSLGHAVGDELLSMIARRLQKNLGRLGSVARMGGDEFTLILDGVTDETHLRERVERVLDAFRLPFFLEGQEMFVTASLGLALYPRDGRTVGELLRLADVAMYHAKRRELGWAVYDGELLAPAPRGVAMESALHRALERSELSLHYQPLVDARSGHVVAVEALLRWDSAEFGRVSPAEFIPITETSGLIVPIGEWVLRQACRDARFLQAVAPGVRVGVNLSTKQFGRADLVTSVQRALDLVGLAPELLSLEITESVLMDQDDAVRRVLDLRKVGVGLAIDDFGTGYSSLNYLKRLPVEAVKLDKTFVDLVAVEPDGIDAQVVRSVRTLCHALRLTLVAEGVETEEQAAFLRDAGVDVLQGWLFGRAMPLADLVTWVHARTAPGA